jgi:hypothetical protein
MCLTTVESAKRGVTLDEAVRRGAVFRNVSAPAIITSLAGPTVVVGGPTAATTAYKTSVAKAGALRTWQGIFGLVRALNKLSGEEVAVEQTLIPPAMTRQGLRESLNESKALRDAIRSERPAISPPEPVSVP